jgi:hypothetical protein
MPLISKPPWAIGFTPPWAIGFTPPFSFGTRVTDFARGLLSDSVAGCALAAAYPVSVCRATTGLIATSVLALRLVRRKGAAMSVAAKMNSAA